MKRGCVALIALVTGGAASGKSQFAERLAVAANTGSLAYLATMQVYDDESAARVEKHRQMRAGRGFETVECPFGLPGGQHLPRFDTALLECLSNLTANVMFAWEKSPAQTVPLVVDCVRKVCRAARNTVIVTNEVFSDGGDYDALTRGYIAALGQINRAVALEADAVIESLCGIPVIYKGKEVLQTYEGLF